MKHPLSCPSPDLIRGSDPHIPLREALCPPKRDRRVKPGDDEMEMGAVT